jgi:hypothetical protein
LILQTLLIENWQYEEDKTVNIVAGSWSIVTSAVNRHTYLASVEDPRVTDI